MVCPRCGSADLIKRGRKGSYQRFVCRDCGRYSTDRQPKFSAELDFVRFGQVHIQKRLLVAMWLSA
jgi:transposase-like protein